MRGLLFDRRWLWLFGVIAFASLLFWVLAVDPAAALSEAATQAQQSPYLPTASASVDLPGPLAPIGQLPVWAQGALAGAVVSGAAYVVPEVVRGVSDLLSRLPWGQ